MRAFPLKQLTVRWPTFLGPTWLQRQARAFRFLSQWRSPTGRLHPALWLDDLSVDDFARTSDWWVGLSDNWLFLLKRSLSQNQSHFSKSWPYGKNPITQLHFYCPCQIQDLSQVWNSKPWRCSWVGGASFEGPSLEQLYWPTWVRITPRDMSSLWSRRGHLLQRK